MVQERIFRIATARDIPEILLLGLSRESAFAAVTNICHGMFFIAKVGPKLVAAAYVEIEELDGPFDEAIAHLKYVRINPRYRRSHIDAGLDKRLRDEMKHRNIRTLTQHT
jgi:hypothetical protein